MIDARARDTISISRRDLAVVAEAVTARFPLRAGETRRLARVRQLLASAGELNRMLAAHTHRVLVHCQGSHGVGDITMDSQALYEALAAYAVLIQETADAYRGLEDDTEVQMRLDVGRDSATERHAAISTR